MGYQSEESIDKVVKKLKLIAIVIIVLLFILVVAKVKAREFIITEICQAQSLPKFQTSGDYMVWESNQDIFYYDGDSVTQVTNTLEPDELNLNNDSRGNLYGPYVVWRGYYNNVYQIFFYDGVEITQITTNSNASYNPTVRRGRGNIGIITWFDYIGSGTYAVFLSQFLITGPVVADLNADGFVDMFDFALLSTYWLQSE